MMFVCCSNSLQSTFRGMFRSAQTRIYKDRYAKKLIHKRTKLLGRFVLDILVSIFLVVLHFLEVLEGVERSWRLVG